MRRSAVFNTILLFIIRVGCLFSPEEGGTHMFYYICLNRKEFSAHIYFLLSLLKKLIFISSPTFFTRYFFQVLEYHGAQAAVRD